MKFNKTSLQGLQSKASKYIVMADGNENIGIRVYPTGKKAFIVRIRLKGKPKMYTIGQYPAISFTKAKELAQTLILKYQAGIDVKEEERIKAGLNKTLRDCLNDYLPTVKPTTQKDITRCINFGWEGWIDKPIKTISDTKVLKVYDTRVKEARNRARLEMAYLRMVWNYHKKELNLSDSPTAILNEERRGWNDTNVKTRRLDDETAPGFYKAIHTLSNRDKNLFLLAYYTGMRISEVMNLKWENINLKNRSLHIAGANTKNGHPLDIPLSKQALAVIENIKDKSPFLFSQVGIKGANKGKITAMTSYSKSGAKIQKQGVMWSPHDSRRGVIVAEGILSLNTYMVKQLTNHYTKNDVHGNYQHYTIGELRPTAQRIGDYLESQLLGTSTRGDNVVELKAVNS